MKYTCPHCGEALEIASGYAGTRVECPLCGAIFISDAMRTDDMVIDVRAEPTDETAQDSFNSDFGPSSERPADATTVRRFHHDRDAPHSRKIHIERRVMVKDSGCGCNGCGCLLLILVLLFLLLGCQAAVLG